MVSKKFLHRAPSLFRDSLGNLGPALPLAFGARHASGLFQLDEDNIAVAPIAQRMTASLEPAPDFHRPGRFAANPEGVHDCLKKTSHFAKFVDRFCVQPLDDFLESRPEVAHAFAGVALELFPEIFSGI